MRKRNFLMITICIIMCTLVTSCGFNNIQKDTTQNKKSVSNETDSLMNKKYTAYIALDNFMTGRLEDSLEHYFKKLGNTAQVNADKDSNFYMGNLLEFNKKELEDNLKYASKKPSFQEVDYCVDELAPKLKELINLLDEADSYYKLKSYVDDDFVKAKELHKKIYLQYNEIKPLAKRFSSEFENIFLKASEEKLKNFKKNDYMIRYYALSVILRAKDLETELNNQGITYENVSDLDIGKFKEKYNLLVEDTNNFLEYSKDSDRIKKEKLDPNFEYANVFKHRITDVKAAATDILTRAQQGDKNKGKEYGTPEYYTKQIKDAICEYVKIS